MEIGADRTYDGQAHGAFTDALLRVLTGRSPHRESQNGFMNYDELADAVEDFMRPRDYGHTPVRMPGKYAAERRVALQPIFEWTNGSQTPALDQTSPIQPELRAIDAYNTEEFLIGWVRSFGITTIHTGHQPSALVSGQTMIAKTTGKDVDEATRVPTAMIAVTLGTDALAAQGKSPGTRAKQIAMLRAELIKAGNYKGEPRDLRQEMWKKVLNREIPLLVTADRACNASQRPRWAGVAYRSRNDA